MFYAEWLHRFHVNRSFFSRNLCSLKNYENHGTCRQAGRDVNWRKIQLSCASKLIETKDKHWVIMLNSLYLGIWNLIYTRRIYIYIYIYAYFVCSLPAKTCFKVRHHKILPRAETLILCMTDKVNKNEMNIDMQSFK